MREQDFERRYLDGVPTLYKGLISKCLDGTASRPQATKAKCLDCVGFEEPRIRIKECETRICPLWHWRPYQEKTPDYRANARRAGENK